MIQGWVRHCYNEYRAKGYNAETALHAARIKDRFTDLENEGLVRLHAEPECDVYDDSYIDTWDHLSEEGKKRAKKELWDQIEREGCWIWIGQWRANDEAEWEYADNIGGIIGDALCGYEIDLMQSAIEALDAFQQSEADNLAQRATFAAGVSQ